MAFGRTYKSEFMRYMTSQGIRYQEKDNSVVRVGYNLDNLLVELFVLFGDNNDEHVSIRCYSIGAFGNDKLKALITCNEMNKQYKWAKFYLDDDNDIMVAADAIVQSGTVGPVLVELCMRLATIIDDAYPIFMKVRWS